jgi:hypothetical protein
MFVTKVNTMIKLKTKLKGITVKTIYFADKPTLWTNFFSAFRSTISTDNYFCFQRSKINTLINSLELSDIDLLNSFTKNTKYEIMRSMRDNLVEIDQQASIADFVGLYNRFATSRGWRSFKVRPEMLKNYWVTACKLNNEVIIAHLYVTDSECKRVCLEASVSDPDEMNNMSLKSFIGRSNRHLHYSDMLYFKRSGFLLYDFGGYDTDNTTDKKKSGINRFKSGFNGMLVYESHYVSYPLLILFGIKKLLRL